MLRELIRKSGITRSATSLALAAMLIVAYLLPTPFGPTLQAMSRPSGMSLDYEVQQVPTGIDKLEVGEEVVAKRTENSKTYYMGDSEYRLEIGGGIQHWKENWNDALESWKECDLTWDNGRIDKAPYILEVDGDRLSFYNRSTGETSTLERTSVSPNLEFEIIPTKAGVSFRHVLPSDKVPFEVKFKVSGPAPRCRAFDDEGELELETSVEYGVLTERLSEVRDKGTGELRQAKGQVRIDPTLTVQPAKDTLLREDQPNENYVGDTNLKIFDRDPQCMRSILEFDLSGLPADATVNSATLALYYYDALFGDPVGKTVWAHKLTRTDWVGSEATWNDYKSGTNWTSSGGDYVTSAPAGGSTDIPASYSWVEWNVKAIVEDAYGNSDPAEFLVKYETEGLDAGNPVHFYSDQHEGDQPKLTIGYNQPTVTTNNATSISTEYATLQGNLTYLGDYSEVNVSFEYGTSTDYGLTTAKETKSSTGTFNADVTGLGSGVQYHYRAAVEFGSDEHNYGNDKAFTTVSYVVAESTGADVLDKPAFWTIGQAKIFGSYLTSGDQLICYRTWLDYASTPEQDAGDFFKVSLVNGTTVLASVPVNGWGEQPGSIYLAPSKALDWGSTGYTLELAGHESQWSSPPTAYASVGSDTWQNTQGDMSELDSWIVNTAAYINSTWVYEGYLIDDACRTFSAAIPSMIVERSVCIEPSSAIKPDTDGYDEYDPDYGENMTLEGRSGTKMASFVEDVGDTIGVGTDSAVGLLALVMLIGVGLAVAILFGSFSLGLMAAAGLSVLLAFMGWLSWWIVVMMAALGAFAFYRKVWGANY